MFGALAGALGGLFGGKKSTHSIGDIRKMASGEIPMDPRATSPPPMIAKLLGKHGPSATQPPPATPVASPLSSIPTKMPAVAGPMAGQGPMSGQGPLSRRTMRRPSRGFGRSMFKR